LGDQFKEKHWIDANWNEGMGAASHLLCSGKRKSVKGISKHVIWPKIGIPLGSAIGTHGKFYVQIWYLRECMGKLQKSQGLAALAQLRIVKAGFRQWGGNSIDGVF